MGEKKNKTYSDTRRGTFDCCRKCGDKRTVGCHGWCKDYIEAYAKHKKNREEERNQKLVTERATKMINKNQP